MHTGLTFSNSPRYHLNLDDGVGVYIERTIVKVDLNAQRELLTKHGHWDALKGLPTFPLNTDGMDISCVDVHIRDVQITNYDDTVCVKPCNKGGKNCQCASNYYVYNTTVHQGVGLTIGSVPPNSNTNCVRNITFELANMYTPIKGIYVKSNPGNNGDAIIDQVIPFISFLCLYKISLNNKKIC